MRDAVPTKDKVLTRSIHDMDIESRTNEEITMSNLRTANTKARHALKRRIRIEGRVFHQKQVERMHASGTLHKLRDTGFIRRRNAADKARVRQIKRQISADRAA